MKYAIALASVGLALAACTPSKSVGPIYDTAGPSAAPAAAAAASGPANSFGDGQYLVGSDIPAGRFKTAGPDKSSVFPYCNWSRNKSDDGEFHSIIANGNEPGPFSVTVKKGEYFQVSGGCTWTKA